MSTWSDSTHCVDGSLRQGPRPGGAPLAPIPVNQSWEPCPDVPTGSLRQGGRSQGFADPLRRGRGAGLTYDHNHPEPLRFQETTNTAGTNYLGRQGLIFAMGLTSAQAPGVTTGVEYKGWACYKMKALTGRQVILGGMCADHHRQRGGARHRGDFANWRARAILAFEPAGSGSLGMEMVQGTDEFGVVGSIGAGLALRPDTNNVVTFYAKTTTSGGFTYSEALDYSLDVSEFNCYEMIGVGATDNEEAFLLIRINGDEVLRLPYGDALLPAGPLTQQVGTRGGGTVYVPPMSIHLGMAPSYEALF